MKSRMFLTVLLCSAILTGCGNDSSTNSNTNGGNGQDSTWTPISSLSFSQYNTRLSGLLIDGDQLYVSGSGGFLAVVDILNRDSLNLLGYHPSDGSSGKVPVGIMGSSMVKLGNYLMCAFTTRYENPDSVEIFNISNPTTPATVAVIQSLAIPLSSGYYSYSGLGLAGDTLAVIQTAWVRLFNVHTDGSFTFLRNVTHGDFSAGGGTISGVWAGPQYWYFFGENTDTAHHPKLWVTQRGSMSLVKENSLPSYLSRTYWAHKETHAYCYNYSRTDFIFEVDASNPLAVTVSRTISVPADLNLPTGLIFDATEKKLLPVDTMFVFLDEWKGGVMLLDQNFRYIKHTVTGQSADAVAVDGILYVVGGQELTAYRLD